MMKVTTDCMECTHNVVCKKSCNPMVVKEKLRKTVVDNNISIDDYTWEEYVKEMGIDVTFSCPDFMLRGRLQEKRQQISFDKDGWGKIECQ